MARTNPRHAKRLVVFATCWLSLPALGADLTPSEITTLITGKTIYGYDADDRQDVVWYFAPDGKVSQRKKSATSPGTWRMDEDGRLCIQLRDPYSDVTQKERCRGFSQEGESYSMYGLGKDGRKKGGAMSVKKIAEGNAENM